MEDEVILPRRNCRFVRIKIVSISKQIDTHELCLCLIWLYSTMYIYKEYVKCIVNVQFYLARSMEFMFLSLRCIYCPSNLHMQLVSHRSLMEVIMVCDDNVLCLLLCAIVYNTIKGWVFICVSEVISCPSICLGCYLCPWCHNDVR